MVISIKATILKFLFRFLCRSDRLYITNNQSIQADLLRADGDTKPLFCFPNGDYSAIDLDEFSHGAACLEFFLRVYDNENMMRVVPALVTLALNRPLTKKEHIQAAYIGYIYEYYLSWGHDDIHWHYMSLIASNTWGRDVLIPVQVSLFILSGAPEAKEWLAELRYRISDIPELINHWVF